MNKIKKISSVVCASLVLGSFVCGCGSGSSSASYDSVSFNSAVSKSVSVADSLETYYDTSDFSSYMTDNTTSTSYSENMDSKIITTMDLSFETLEYDKFIVNMYSYLDKVNGYVESSNESGSSRSSSSLRYSNFTLRIPEKNLNTFVSDISDSGNILNKSVTTENITLEYVDIASRLSSLNEEKEILLSLLKQAETMEDIITIEDKISDLQYQIENYTSRLRLYDNLVSYSTIYLYISEVKEITEPEPENFGSRLVNSVSASFDALGNNFSEFFIWFLAALPHLIVFGLIGFIIYLIIKDNLKKTKLKEKEAENNIKSVTGSNESNEGNNGSVNDVSGANDVNDVTDKNNQTF